MASTTTAGTSTGSGWIEKWNPEDKEFWENGGKQVARRNLIFSIFAEFLGFSVWQLFSIVAALLPAIGFAFTSPQLLSLVALPGLVGATMRFPYTFAVGIFGGRNWTIISMLILLLPTVMLGIIIQHPDTPYWQFAVAAALGGFGGGNFSSSMANISYFYPNEQKGTALGINAAGGNLGVGIVQLLVPFVITVGALGAIFGNSQTRSASESSTGSATGVVSSEVFLQNAAFFWIPFIVLAAVCAYFFMNNLNISQAPPGEQARVAKRKHTWVMSYLYIGTFGSFIGYSASFPVLISSQFPEYSATWLAAIGPIVGSLARPVGGWLSDKVGGASVTFWNFIVMALGVVAVLYLLAVHSFAGFFLAFMVLFLTAGVGNGSTYRMIPFIFRTERIREARDRGEGARTEEAARQGQKEGSFVLGFAGAIAAYGGFIIPQAYKYSIGATGGPQTALISFIVFYVTCIAVTWWFYYRKNAEIPC
jgi:NNP family nitrate/nitrite transporter-like MFS transporter